MDIQKRVVSCMMCRCYHYNLQQQRWHYFRSGASSRMQHISKYYYYDMCNLILFVVVGPDPDGGSLMPIITIHVPRIVIHCCDVMV